VCRNPTPRDPTTQLPLIEKHGPGKGREEARPQKANSKGKAQSQSQKQTPYPKCKVQRTAPSKQQAASKLQENANAKNLLSFLR